MSAGNNWANDLSHAFTGCKKKKKQLPRTSVMSVTRTNVFICIGIANDWGHTICNAQTWLTRILADATQKLLSTACAWICVLTLHVGLASSFAWTITSIVTKIGPEVDRKRAMQHCQLKMGWLFWRAVSVSFAAKLSSISWLCDYYHFQAYLPTLFTTWKQSSCQGNLMVIVAMVTLKDHLV